MLSGWGLVGSFKGYMLIKLVLAANLFFMRQYFLTIPRDFEEAAKLDNAGHFKTFRKVMLPLAGPALAAITILTFQGIWNEFFWPLILLGFGNPDHYTVQLGLAQFSFQYQTLWPELMAASVIAIVPIVVIFLFFQRYFVAGVVASGVKG
jgi:multiple sugar transport system permease protein